LHRTWRGIELSVGIPGGSIGEDTNR
jgi:hypothetical protein